MEKTIGNIVIDYQLDNIDFPGFFHRITDEVAYYITNPEIKKIIVTAGPFRPYGASLSWINKENGIISIDYYSALRAGFGSISAKEVYDGINNNEISLEPNPYLD